jgi:hypothetical protein
VIRTDDRATHRPPPTRTPFARRPRIPRDTRQPTTPPNPGQTHRVLGRLSQKHSGAEPTPAGLAESLSSSLSDSAIYHSLTLGTHSNPSSPGKKNIEVNSRAKPSNFLRPSKVSGNKLNNGEAAPPLIFWQDRTDAIAASLLVHSGCFSQITLEKR